MRLVATEACRRARNGNHFLALVARETGLRLEVIRPEEEARLAVISCAPLVSPDASQVLVFDIGGGSTELVWIDLGDVAPCDRAQAIVDLQVAGGGGGPGKARIVDFISVPLGVATLHDRFADVDRRQRAVCADVLVLRGADRRLQALPRHPGGGPAAAVSR